MCPYAAVQLSKDDYHMHFEKVHDIPVRQNHYSLDSVEEFYSWKNVIEKTSSYIKRFSTEPMVYYQCNRCGNHKSRGHTKWHTKVSGLIK